MKIAILYDSKYGNTKRVAEFMADKIQAGDHEVQLFRTTKTKPAKLLAFQPEAILVGGPTHWGRPARTLSKYIKKIGNLRDPLNIHKAAVFNCNTGDDVCKTIQNQISDALPKIEVFDKSLSIHTGGQDGDKWKEIALPNNWIEDTNRFLSEFLSFLS